MNNRRAIAIAAMAVIAIGAVVVLTLRAFAPGGEAPPPQPPVAADVATVAPAAESGSTIERTPEAPPPWLQPQDPPLAADSSPPAADPAQVLREQQMAKLRASMQGVFAAATARSAETRRHLRDALDTLDAMDDPAVTSQVDLDAVRHNLDTSIRMQELAQQVQQIAARPESPEHRQQMDAAIAELRRLQAQLRQDVRAPGSTLPATGIPKAAP